MITQLQGNLAGIDNDALTVEIEVAGMTYGVLVPLFLWPEIHALAGEAELDNPAEQPVIRLHVYYHATANSPAPVLVGFFRRAEREFFRKFTTVEGIGPLKAVKAMSVSVSVIARSIEQEDRAGLAKLPGIGPRAADKVIATLRGKVTAEAAMHDAGIETPVDTASLEQSRVSEDAIAAVVALGYGRTEARRWVEAALENDGALASVEDLTLAVLRERGAMQA